MENSDIKEMLELHILDKQLFDINELRGTLPENIEKLNQKLESLTSQANNSDNNVIELNKNKKSYNTDLTDNLGKIKKLNDQIFKVKTNKEYDALLNEIEHLKKDNQLKEKELESIESQLRDIEVSSMKSATEIDKLKESLDSFNSQLNDINSKIKDDENKLLKQKTKARKKIVNDSLSLYDSKCHDYGLAFSEIIRDACSHCYSSLPAQTIINADDVNILQSCPTCNIFLYKETENN